MRQAVLEFTMYIDPRRFPVGVDVMMKTHDGMVAYPPPTGAIQRNSILALMPPDQDLRSRNPSCPDLDQLAHSLPLLICARTG
jgi:hypothetical protein